MTSIQVVRANKPGVGRPDPGGLALARGVRCLYQQSQSDYALEPLVVADRHGQSLGRIASGDTVIFCCRRGEREIQLTEAFTQPNFDHFPRPALKGLAFVPLTLYHEKFKHLPVAFAPERVVETLGECVSRHGLRQLRVAESEKYAHVTFFLDGGVSQPFPGQINRLVPSAKEVPYTQASALSLLQVVAEVLAGMRQGYDLIVANFANGDVIGHTREREAKLQCAQIVDQALGQVVQATLQADYSLLVTADHGNLEEMFHADGSPHGAHTTNPVTLLWIENRRTALLDTGETKLADIAPTVLDLLGVPVPPSMTGASLAGPVERDAPRRVVLLILDGWGLGRQDDRNPIYLAPTPVWDDLLQHYPSLCLQAAGPAVGLMAGKPGNSEAGHMNIGAGRVVLQDDVRLERAIRDGSFSSNPVLSGAIQQAGLQGAGLHLIALLSEKSSHGSLAYPLALLKMAAARGLEKVYLHLIFDGRSTPPGSAPDMLGELAAQVSEIGCGQIVSGVGRAYALDRDGNYARTQRAYDAMVSGVGIPCRLD